MQISMYFHRLSGQYTRRNAGNLWCLPSNNKGVNKTQHQGWLQKACDIKFSCHKHSWDPLCRGLGGEMTLIFNPLRSVQYILHSCLVGDISAPRRSQIMCLGIFGIYSSRSSSKKRKYQKICCFKKVMSKTTFKKIFCEH